MGAGVGRLSACLAFSLVAFSPPAPAAEMGRQHVASDTVQDLSHTFPTTAVGQTAGFCTNVCYCTDASHCSCDGSGTVVLDHDLSTPFSALDYRLQDAGNSNDCAGGAPVTLPVFVTAGKKLSFVVEFSPNTPGTFSDYLNLSGYNLFVSGSAPSGPPPRPGQAGVMYATSNSDSSVLYSISNFSTNPQTSLIGDTGLSFPAIAISPVSGIIYAIDSSTGQLFQLDAQSGASTLVGDTGLAGAVPVALACDRQGHLFTWGNNDGVLYQLDPASGAASTIGYTGYAAGGDLAFDANGTLYGSTGTDLIAIDPGTAASISIGSFGTDRIFGLAIASDGTLYAGQAASDGTGALYRVDKTNAQVTLVGALDQTVADLALFGTAPPAANLRLVATAINLTPMVASFTSCAQASGATHQAHDTQRVDVAGADATLNLAIGEAVDLRIVRVNSDGSDGVAVSSTFSVLSEAADPPPVTTVLASEPPALFDGHVMLTFSSEANRFFATHSGTSSIGVTTASGAFTLTVQVASSGYRLGQSHNTDDEQHSLDDPVLGYADRRGIPPQIVKAVIGKETGFVEKAYRYEPLAQDFALLSACGAQPASWKPPCKVDDLRQSPHYSPYAIATFGDAVDTTALPAGANLTPEELALASDYYYVTVDAKDQPLRTLLRRAPKGSRTRHLSAADASVSMENLLYTNNTARGWYLTGSTSEAGFYSLRSAGTLTPFAAQTVLSASYGLMQVLVTTAFDTYYRAPAGAVGDPIGLFDLTTNLDVGTEVLAAKYRALAFPSQFATLSDLGKAWCRTLVRYNGAGTLAQQYGAAVFAASNKYFPIH